MNNQYTDNPNTALVSIIIATYNAAAELEGCLLSIVQHGGANIEIVVVDGGSTDDTIAIIERLALPNLIYTSGKDAGIYDALNKGTKLAKGQWLNFLGADDRLLPGFAALVGLLKDNYTIYYGNSEANFANCTVPFEFLSGPFSNYRLAKYCMNHQSIIYPAIVFKQYQYNLRYTMLADYDLNLKLWGNKTFKKEHHPISIVLYNMAGVSATISDDLFKKDKPALIRKSLGWFIYLRFVIKRYKKRKANNFY